MHEETPEARDDLRLGSHAPDFEAVTTQGPIRYYDWKGERWSLLVSHPADFTPVCTSELVALARRHEDFERRGVAVLATSVDSVYAHLAWLSAIHDRFDVAVPFPIVADLDQKVARLYGMIHEPTSATSTVRSAFFVDPKNRVRAFAAYPLDVGRSVDELLRVLDALQTVDRHGVGTPEGWRPGEPVLLAPPATTGEVERRRGAKDLELTDWYFARREL